MGALRDWAFAVCAAMAAGGIFRMALPKSNMQKIFGVTCSAFFLCVLLSPAVFGVPGIELGTGGELMPDIQSRAQALTDTANSQAGRAGLEGVEKIIREKLSQMGINGGDTTINIITNGQHGPGRVDITLDASHEGSHDHIRTELANALGLEVRIGYEGNDR
ncbi:MAG: stage III sporulation protein AF [Oscillospiraceae bacterium]|nr:stage III sporulation protein AF [Oscillospiraceae bacterium]